MNNDISFDGVSETASDWQFPEQDFKVFSRQNFKNHNEQGIRIEQYDDRQVEFSQSCNFEHLDK